MSIEELQPGQKFKYYTVISKVPGVERNRWFFRCVCGKINNLRRDQLITNPNSSCGCKSAAIKHGEYGSKEYRSWADMKKRCLNPKNAAFQNYGGRGITVCKKWHDFKNFIEDMGASPSPKHTLERIDSNGNYEPTNCCWASRAEQARNKRTSVMVSYNGCTKHLSIWAEELGLERSTLYQRIFKYKWSLERAFQQPLRK